MQWSKKQRVKILYLFFDIPLPANIGKSALNFSDFSSGGYLQISISFSTATGLPHKDEILIIT